MLHSSSYAALAQHTSHGGRNTPLNQILATDEWCLSVDMPSDYRRQSACNSISKGSGSASLWSRPTPIRADSVRPDFDNKFNGVSERHHVVGFTPPTIEFQPWKYQTFMGLSLSWR